MYLPNSYNFSRDLEESRRREVKLREKIKDLSDLTPEESKQNNSSDLKSVVDRLQKEMELVKSQNLALRRAVALNGGDVSRTIADALRRGEEVDSNTDGRFESKGGEDGDRPNSAPPGHRLGSQDDSSATPFGSDVRKLQHAKWETEKKMQKRLVNCNRISTLRSI